MSVLNLDKLFHPASIAVIGATDRPGAVGKVVLDNILAGGFAGPVYPVNPHTREINGITVYPDVAGLPAGPELAVIATPAATVPEVIVELGRHGTAVAIVLADGFRKPGSDAGNELQQAMLTAARASGMRIIGPNCIGVLLPRIGLNASFAHAQAKPGRLAFLSQSGALCTAVLDWANARGIGFSSFVSLGDAADVDFGDLLDFLGSDPDTHGILLYVESIRHARKFLSAARSVSRNRRVIILKAGRQPAGARAALTHTGALLGNDEVFDAAIRRAGMLRVQTVEDLFSAAETLAFSRPARGPRLLVLTNGGGPGVLVADQLTVEGGTLAVPKPETIAALDEFLPRTWSRGNPVDIIGDADAGRYRRALRVLLDANDFDAILVMLVPTAVVDNVAVARAVAEEAQSAVKPVLTCWLGGESVRAARRVFIEAGVASYFTPELAVRAFMQMVEYDRNQKSLIQTPASTPEAFAPREAAVRSRIRAALDGNRAMLTEPEAKAVLEDYGIPTVPARVAADVNAAVSAAAEIGYPVALKILSPDLTHKSDAGGVLLDIGSPSILAAAAEGMLARVRQLKPDARVEGFTVQPMVRRPGSHELIVGVAEDPVFGPALTFGQGGTAVEVVRDTAVALPPLNDLLADQLIQRTRICRVLQGFRSVRGADLEAVRDVLVRVSELVIDQPEIAELDINPLLVDGDGVIALDARIRVQRARSGGAERLAIRPYPRELEEQVEIQGEKLLIRPIRPEDEPAHREFFARLNPEDLYFRFFRAVHDVTHEQLARFTQIDYDREMALIATRRKPDGTPETLGVVRAVSDADNIAAEFAVIVRTDWHQRGLGQALMERIIAWCRRRGTRRLAGQTLAANTAMQALAKRFGFSRSVPSQGVVNLELPLTAR
ncbi:MAG: bifunctional acetate--CoA ligase family protein/GNAT family N-acetyltransferase [Gammaproteobacteria bacterium]|nr:bifunctional acetate--CoA ligase family protein/GNAT family N-acetyltransferase [Gammaproteobacteria bacterium]